MFKNRICGAFKKHILVFLLIMPILATADNAYDYGEYIVYYNAFTADSLSPEMASAYGIVRSKYKAVLNVSVQKKQAIGKLPVPVNAVLKVDALNLAGQAKNLSLRRVSEGKAIYYIADFRISNEELVRFDISLRPEGQVKALEFGFKQRFFID